MLCLFENLQTLLERSPAPRLAGVVPCRKRTGVVGFGV